MAKDYNGNPVRVGEIVMAQPEGEERRAAKIIGIFPYDPDDPSIEVEHLQLAIVETGEVYNMEPHGVDIMEELDELLEPNEGGV